NRGALPPSPADASASPAAVAPSATPGLGPTPGPSPRLTLRVTSSAVDVAALVAATPRRGTGPLAFVAGSLRSTPRRCPPNARLSACITLRIDGLRGLGVVPDDAMGSWPGDPPAGETLVLLPRDGQLVLLGSLVVDPAGIPSVEDVLARQVNNAASPGRDPSLFEADGVLIDGAGACPPGNSCPGLVATLVANPPLAGPNAGQQFARPVGVAPGAIGISPGEGAWTTGPFLLRWSPRPAAREWQVVAREDQGSVLHVLIP
ncbi:MAG TPA: hypothetical protein VIR16_08195, partial [Candidatus Limnocylindrales bacterium]